MTSTIVIIMHDIGEVLNKCLSIRLLYDYYSYEEDDGSFASLSRLD